MILLVLLIIAVVGWWLFKKTDCDITGTIAGGLSIMSIGGFIVAIIYFAATYISIDVTIAKNEAKYEALMYKVQTENARDQLGLLNKDYIDEVQEWNEYVAEWKAGTKNLWVGIFYPNKISDCLEVIDLQSFEGGKK